MYKFSIIVPCYNIENRAKKLFEMLASKSYDNYEVIFVDDCSKDKSFKVMKDLVKKYDTFYVCQTTENGGPGLARNLGMQCAKGEYIIFCDSDDEFDICALEEMESFLSDHPESDMLVSPHRKTKNDKSVIVDLYSKYAHAEQIDRSDVVLGNLAPWGKIYKASIIKQYQIEFPARRTGEDICFVVNYLTRCNTVFKFNVAYYSYVRNGFSVTHEKAKDFESTFDILQPIYREYFPSLEVRMFAQNHLLTKAKYLTDHGASSKEIRTFFSQQNLRYPNWIQCVELEKQSAYRRYIYKAMYYNHPLMVKFIMFVRRILY